MKQPLVIKLPKALVTQTREKPSQRLARLQALSHLRLLRADIEKGHVFVDDKGVERVNVTTRLSRAAYLSTALDDIDHGVDPTDALCLTKGKGAAKKEERDVVIAMLIHQLHEAGHTIESAVALAAEALSISEETVRTSRKKGQKIASVLASLQASGALVHDRSHEPLLRLLRGHYV